MNLKRYLSKPRITELTKTDLASVAAEMLATVPDSILGTVDRKTIVANLIEKEKSISTYLDDGICMPHTRVAGLKQKYVFIVGRAPNGISFGGMEDYKNTKVVFMMLSNEKADDYLSVLTSLAKTLTAEESLSSITQAKDLTSFRNAVIAAFDGGSKQNCAKGAAKRKEEKVNEIIMRSALKISKTAKCSTIMLFGDAFSQTPDIPAVLGDTKVVLVSEKAPHFMPAKWQHISIKAISDMRFSQLKSAVMVGLTRGILETKEKICCVAGVRDSDQIDTVIILDIEKEFSNLLIGQKNMLPDDVEPEVVERVIDIATELSVEGREGKPVGCIFVIGNIDEIKPHLKQLILNPFFGYKPEDRNVLNPFMDETVKEYSLIDGAFIIDGSGSMEAAGALIHTPDFKLQLPGGLGARHAAAYAISLMADCVSIVVSSSTGQITLFRKGQMLPITDKRR